MTERTCSQCGKPHNEDTRWCPECKARKRKHNKEYYPIEKEKDNARSKAWRVKNPEKVKKNNAKRYLVDPVKYRLQVKQWVSRNPQRRSIISNRYSHNRRARMNGNGGNYTSDELNALMVSQEYSCFYCSKPFFDNTLDTKIHVDHKIPISRGGKNNIANIALTCPQCNLSKNARTAEEFISLLKK
jgi:5-methylcytosine-specific restriction endonuclease McrA